MALEHMLRFRQVLGAQDPEPMLHGGLTLYPWPTLAPLVDMTEDGFYVQQVLESQLYPGLWDVSKDTRTSRKIRKAFSLIILSMNLAPMIMVALLH